MAETIMSIDDVRSKMNEKKAKAEQAKARNIFHSQAEARAAQQAEDWAPVYDVYGVRSNDGMMPDLITASDLVGLASFSDMTDAQGYAACRVSWADTSYMAYVIRECTGKESVLMTYNPKRGWTVEDLTEYG